MGLPAGHFVCASNDNKVLYDFFRTGVYDRNRAFHVTVSPSMDILISSNLERLLCHMGGQDKTKAEMAALQAEGKYTAEITEERLSGEFADEAETFDAIRRVYKNIGYVMDHPYSSGLCGGGKIQSRKRYKEPYGYCFHRKPL